MSMTVLEAVKEEAAKAGRTLDDATAEMAGALDNWHTLRVIKDTHD